MKLPSRAFVLFSVAAFAAGDLQSQAQPTNEELQLLLAGHDASNTKGAFDMAIDQAEVSEHIAKITAASDSSSELPNAPFNEIVTPLSDPFDVKGADASIGESPNGNPLFGSYDESQGGSNAMPPMEPLPYIQVQPEAPPPIPDNISPLDGDTSKCQGGEITDSSAYYGCHTIEGYLSITNTHLNSLDDFMSIESVDSLPGFDNNGIGILIKGNTVLENIDGLSNLNGKIPGSVVIVDNEQLQNLGGLNGVTTVEGKSTVTGQSIIISNNPQLQNINGLSGLSGALAGSISITNNALLSNVVGLESVISAGNDKNGWSVQVDSNAELLSLSGLNGLQTITGGVHISTNAKLQTVAMQSLTSMGCSTSKNPSKSCSTLKCFTSLVLIPWPDLCVVQLTLKATPS